MESPEQKLLRLLVEKDPASPEFPGEVRAALRPAVSGTGVAEAGDFDLWHDVFVDQPLPWGRFLQSAILHGAAVALILTMSLAWMRQQKILAFDRSQLVVFTPDEYLPPLDTGAAEAPKPQKADPVYAKQPILSVPREADNRSQTIVVPPDLKLNHDVPLPNIVATGVIAPEVPLDATRASMSRVVAPDTPVVAPAPDVAFAPDRVVQAAMKTEVIAPPPDLTQSKGRVGQVNIAPSAVVAPAPQLTLEAQHTVAARGRGLPGSVQPVGPPPSVSAAGGSGASGRLIALGIHPVAPRGPVAVPAGNRRGTFSAGPHGKAGASGAPELTGSKSDAKGAGRRSARNGSLPAGLHVGRPDAGDDAREIASASPAGHSTGRAATPVSEDKITDVERQVFAGKRLYAMTLNVPNLNSSTGSWVIRFAELHEGQKEGELLAPVATEQSDPGYPLELMRSNVHGMVTLYAVIHADGGVGDIRVLESPDDRLNEFAAKALARWKFVPAERAGKAVAIEAVVEIPFRVRRSF